MRPILIFWIMRDLNDPKMLHVCFVINGLLNLYQIDLQNRQDFCIKITSFLLCVDLHIISLIFKIKSYTMIILG